MRRRDLAMSRLEAPLDERARTRPDHLAGRLEGYVGQAFAIHDGVQGGDQVRRRVGEGPVEIEDDDRGEETSGLASGAGWRDQPAGMLGAPKPATRMSRASMSMTLRCP